MGTDCAVCYVSDINFLLPSLVSAVGVRRFVPSHKADIYILTVGVPPDAVERIERETVKRGIHIIPIDESRFDSIDKDRLTRTFTPMAMFGRLFMHELLPACHKRIVYLDGDLWIQKDPSALIEAVVPEGFFAAVDDTIFLRQKLGFGYVTREIRQYFDNLGLKRENGYFNSGVFAVSRKTLQDISKEAYAYYIDHAALCEHSPDQSALNAVVGDRRLRLSYQWNFQTQLKIWGADRYIEPHIIHFNRNPKPWMGRVTPWVDMYDAYQKAVEPFASLGLPLKQVSEEDVQKANQFTKDSYSYLQYPFVSRLALRLMSFQKYEEKVWL